MAPLSAVALSIWLVLFGMTEAGWATISGKVLGVIAIIVAIIILLDTFWWHTARYIGNRQGQPAGPVQ